MLEERARASGLTLSEWVRDVLLAAPVEPGAESGEVVLAEVAGAAVAVPESPASGRAKGPMTEAEMRGLIERADGVKMQRARERLEAARKASAKRTSERRRTQARGGLSMAEWGRKQYCETVAEPGARCGRGERFFLSCLFFVFGC